MIADQTERARLLREGIACVAEQLGVTAVVPEKTFAEVVNLVEWPTVAVGTFDEEFLSVPREILENAMESHQRYFPVERADGSLDNRFIVAHNGDPARTEAIVRGHERVIRARLSDAAFFYREDLTKPIEAFVAQLDTIVFQDKLGSLGDKVRRTERLAATVAGLADASAEQTAYAERAAHLAKADLVSSAVVEFTDLQGVMGGYYALAAGEEPGVAEAIVDHYRPRFAGDDLPRSLAGRIVAIADKLDTIAGIFAAGMAPTGSADPYALRRSAIGVLQMLLAGLPATLDELIAASLSGYVGVLSFDVRGDRHRDQGVLRRAACRRSCATAGTPTTPSMRCWPSPPTTLPTRLHAVRRSRRFARRAATWRTCRSPSRVPRTWPEPELGVAVDTSIMGPEELALADALDRAEQNAAQLAEVRAYSALLEIFAGLRGPIDAFFEGVMVMSDDPAERDNRLRLLNRFVALFGTFADFSVLSG